MESLVVTIGGKGGQSVVMGALRRIKGIRRIGITTSFDSGGSTGALASELDLPGFLGDVAGVISILIENNDALKNTLNHRFVTDGSLNIHTVRNLVLAGAIRGNKNDILKALKTMCKMADLGNDLVMPISIEMAELCGRRKNGGLVCGETNIDNLGKDPKEDPRKNPIVDVFLRPSVFAWTPALEALEKATKIVISMGDPWSTIRPVFLAQGIKEVLRDTKAKITVIINLVTKHGETNGFRAENYLECIETGMGRECDHYIYNTMVVSERFLDAYKEKEKKEMMMPHSTEFVRDRRAIGGRFAITNEEGHIVHSIPKLQAALERLIRK